MNTWVKVLVIALLMSVSAAGGFKTGEMHVQARWDARTISDQKAEKKRLEIAAAAQIEADRASAQETHRRMERAAEVEKVKDEKLASLNARVSSLSRELRARPDRPAAPAAAGNPAIAQGCTGAQLYRPDAEFLVGEAARADRILAERDACYQQYDSLTKKESMTGAKAPATD